jgi:methylthioribose-1-phosphate isomerase
LFQPFEQEYVEITDATGGWSAIRSMQVRGAPAIAIAAALSLAVEADKQLHAKVRPLSDEKFQLVLVGK